jgi:hypothetical protein
MVLDLCREFRTATETIRKPLPDAVVFCVGRYTSLRENFADSEDTDPRRSHPAVFLH